MDDEEKELYALALIAGAEAIEASKPGEEKIVFCEKELSYREAAIMLRERACTVLYAAAERSIYAEKSV